MQEEIRFLIAENLGLREQLDAARQAGSSAGLEAEAARIASDRAPRAASVTATSSDANSGSVVSALPARGLLEISLHDAPVLVTDLIVTLDVPALLARVRAFWVLVMCINLNLIFRLKGELPTLPAHLLFMAVLHADAVDDAALLNDLMSRAILCIKVWLGVPLPLEN